MGVGEDRGVLPGLGTSTCSTLQMLDLERLVQDTPDVHKKKRIQARQIHIKPRDDARQTHGRSRVDPE